MKNTTTKNVIAFAFAAIVFVTSQTAFAYVPGVWEPQPHSGYIEPAFTKVPMTYDAPIAPQTAQTPVYTTPVQQPVTPTKSVSTNTTTKTRTSTVARANTANTNTNRGFTTSTSNQNAQNNGFYSDNSGMYANNTASDLTALSLQGSGGFMPSSVWQWLIVILLILVIIIIARRLGAKHDHHEVHTVTGH